MTITRHEDSVYGVAVSPDGKLVASSSLDKKLRLTHTMTGTTQARIYLGSTFNHAVDFSFDGQYVLSGYKTIGVFSALTGKCVSSCKGHKHEINTARFSPDGKHIATGSGSVWVPADFSVRIWETTTGKLIKRVDLDDKIESLVWVDHQQILVMTSSELVRIDAEQGSFTPLGPTPCASQSMGYCPTTQRIIVAKEYGCGAMLIGGEGDSLRDLRPVIEHSENARRFTRCVAVKPGGGFATGTTVRDYAKSLAETCYIVHWDARGQEISRSEWHGSFVHGIAYAPDGQTLYSGDSKNEVRGWRVSDGAPIALKTPLVKKRGRSRRKGKTTRASRPLFIFSDVFGVTRISFGKKMSLKSSTKLSIGRELQVIDEADKRLLVDGRTGLGEHDDGSVYLVNLPGLGVKARLPVVRAPVSLWPGEGMLVQLIKGALILSDVNDDQAAGRRRLALDEAPRLAGLAIGPARNYEVDKVIYDVNAQPMLAVAPDGCFAGVEEDILYAGRLGRDGAKDTLWWACPLRLHPTARKTLTITRTVVRFAVLDHAASQATILTMQPDGEHATVSVPSITMPAWTGALLAYQPTSDRVIYRDWRTGDETAHDIGAHNLHPHPAPEPCFYKNNDPAQFPAPTRLPGTLCTDHDRILWVPWHRETIVDPVTQEHFSRDLPFETGPMRRGMMEIFARANVSLATLQLEQGLAQFEQKAKYKQFSMALNLPRCPSTLAYAVATQAATDDLFNRYERHTHGWYMGASSYAGGCRYVWGGTAGVEDTYSSLQWMRSAQIMPIEISTLHGRYTNILGIPITNEHARPPLSSGAERLWLRALLETLKQHGSWDDVAISMAWTKAPIDKALLQEGIAAIPCWTRPESAGFGGSASIT